LSHSIKDYLLTFSLRSDLIETYKIMKGHYDAYQDSWFELDEGDRRGHDQKLFKRRFRLSRKYVSSNRVVDNWNSLTAHYIDSSTFKMHVSSERKSGAVKF